MIIATSTDLQKNPKLANYYPKREDKILQKGYNKIIGVEKR